MLHERGFSRGCERLSREAQAELEGPLTATFVAPGALLVGEVRLAADSSVWYATEVRGEAAPVEIGPQANVQDNCVVEARPGRPVRIGARVSVGHNARIFGAVVEERALIAIGATLLPGAHIGARAIVAANATVPEDLQVPPGMLVIGQGRILREVTAAEIERVEHGADEYVRLAREHAARGDRQA